MFARILLAAALLLPAAAAAQLRWQEGRHYVKVPVIEIAQAPEGKIAITEVFSYACPACNSVRPRVRELEAALPADTALTLLPAGFNPANGWPMFQRAFLTAQSLGLAQANHERFFAEIWDTGTFPFIDPSTGRPRRPLPTIEDAARFYAKGGAVTEAAFLRKAASPEIDAAVQRAEEAIERWRVPGTPSFVVNGRYLVNLDSLRDWDELAALIGHLAGLERDRLKQAPARP